MMEDNDVMYKYLLLQRGRSIGTQPADVCGWRDYATMVFVPEYGVYAWGELYYDRPLTKEEIDGYELYECGYTTQIQKMDYLEIRR